MSKILNLFNPKKWIQGVIFKKVAAKAGKYAATAAAAIIAVPTVSEALGKAAPFLSEAGIDVEKVLVVGLMAAIGALLNWLKHGPLKD